MFPGIELEIPSMILYASTEDDGFQRCITTHPFNHSISIASPISFYDNLQLPDLYYQKKIFKLQQFIHPEFMSMAVKGQYTAISTNSRIDTDNVFALTNTGILVLNVTKETYEAMGLIGKISKFSSKGNIVKYQIIIDLNEQSFAPGNKNYERVKWSFTNVLNQDFEFLFVDLSKNSQPFKECKKECLTLENIYAPSFETFDFKKLSLEQKYELSELIEWVGMAEMNADRKVDPFISTYSPPPGSIESDLHKIKIHGIIHPNDIENLAKQVQKLVNDEKMPWAYINILGFRDAPVSWNLKEHGFYKSGENDLIILINKSNSLTIQIVGKYDDIQ